MIMELKEKVSIESGRKGTFKFVAALKLLKIPHKPWSALL